MPLLSIRDLAVSFAGRRQPDSVQAVDGIDLDLEPGQSHAIVGESGCGKTVTALAVLGLLPRRAARVGGSVVFEGQPLLELPDSALRRIRGRRLAMVFQDPLTSLNPVLTVGRQIEEVLEVHFGQSRAEARGDAVALLERVGIPDPARRAREYPHQLSGGMRQRVMIAVALACRPRLLIADEPTTALDVTTEAQILELLRELVTESGTAMILITHDLGVVARLCEWVHVMYRGRIVESAPRRELFARPRHPYTAGLLASVPRVNTPDASLEPISGSPRDSLPWSEGCAFVLRCPNRLPDCRGGPPLLADLAPRHALRCLNPIRPPEHAP